MVEKKRSRNNNLKEVEYNKMIETLIEHNIKLQHKMTDLVVEMKDLNKKVSNMVDLFTGAGEHIKKGKYEDPLLVKLDDLLDQNKNIAKGLLMLEKFIRDKDVSKTTFGSRPFQRPQGENPEF